MLTCGASLRNPIVVITVPCTIIPEYTNVNYDQNQIYPKSNTEQIKFDIHHYSKTVHPEPSTET